MKKILFFFLLGLVTRQETMAQSQNTDDSSYVVVDKRSSLESIKPIRVKTVAIVLHTMEGWFRYGLKDMIDSAYCNYAISTSGEIVCIVDKYKMANHAGKSMLNGDTSISNITIGIEFEGFSAVHPTPGQLSPRIAKFIHDLQIEFNIPDSMVIIHPTIACFYPNMIHTPYHGYYARGRKSDAFFFATEPVRQKLGLGPMMKYDRDVWEGRVIQNVAQAKRMGMHVYTKEEIAERVAYLARVEKRRQDSIEASRVQPIEFCTVDCIAVNETFALAEPLRQSAISTSELSKQKQFFSLSPFLLPRRLKVKP